MKINESDIQELLKSAQLQINQGNFEKAKNLFKKVISINNNIPEVYNNLGSIYLNEKNFKEAIKYLNQAIKLNPKLSIAYLNLGIIYQKVNDFKLAEENYLQSILFNKYNLLALFNLGNLYSDNDNLENAEKYYKQLIDLKPNMEQAYRNLFFIFDRSNQHKKLKDLLDLAKMNLPNHPIVDFFQGIYDYENTKFEAVIDNFEKIKINEKDIGIFITKSQLLGKSYDQIGDYDKAYNCFLDSNNVINKIFGNRYKKEIYIDIIKERINFYHNFKLNSWGSISSSDNDPIFLVGFPRSGTTLLDTILRSHKSIDVIEEKPIVDKLIENLKLETENNLLNLENLNKKSYTKIKELYLKTRGEYAKSNNEKIYIDKLPLNFIYIGEIIRLFPKAKFIFALRNPYDVILSCFMQQFTPNDSMMNFINLKDSANFYDISMKLYKMYFELFKSNIYEIKYEDVIQNFDDTIKKLLNFLNLEWEDEVKKFYKTARERGIISTPSYNQINKPLYQKSIHRWRNYEKNFAEIDTDLNFWKNEFKY
jgi:tetratricopeptide (TPR) repeat protein